MELLDWAKKFAGACSANTEIEDLKNAAEKGKQLVDAAKMSSAFLDKFARSPKILEDASKALENVSKALGKLETACKDIMAIMQIHKAIKVLSDEKVIYQDPEKAAKAFGSLFVGFGTLAKHLPPPANEYSAILLGCGNFFADVSRGTIPHLRKNYQEYELMGAFD